MRYINTLPLFEPPALILDCGVSFLGNPPPREAGEGGRGKGGGVNKTT